MRLADKAGWQKKNSSRPWFREHTLSNKDRPSLLPVISLSAFFVVLYRLTATRAFSYDGICYSLDAERAPLTNLFHPNHLLYSFIGRLVYILAALTGHPLRALPLMQGFNALIA